MPLTQLSAHPQSLPCFHQKPVCDLGVRKSFPRPAQEKFLTLAIRGITKEVAQLSGDSCDHTDRDRVQIPGPT